MFLLDIDGCITDGKGQDVNLLSLQKLKQLIHESVGETSLCTGRSALYVEAIAQMLNIKNWCICENGAYIYHTVSEELIYHPNVTAETRKHLQEIKTILINSPEFNKISKIELGKEVCISLNPIGLSITDLYELILDKIDLEGVHVAHSTTAVDITPKNINKGSTLLLLCKLKDIDISNIIGVGDTMGDLSFLELCKKTACPSNAIADIKKSASFVANSPSTEGLVEIYKYFR